MSVVMATSVISELSYSTCSVSAKFMDKDQAKPQTTHCTQQDKVRGPNRQSPRTCRRLTLTQKTLSGQACLVEFGYKQTTRINGTGILQVGCPSWHLTNSATHYITTTTLHPFNGLFSRTTWVSWYHKGKTSLDLNDTRDDEVCGRQWHQLDHMQTTCTSLQTDNHTNTSSVNFYRVDALPDARPTVSKH